MSEKKKLDYHLYVDGSALTNTKRYGIGWIRTNQKDRKPSRSSMRLAFNKACSITAEVFAAAAALNHVRQNSNIVVHSDSSIVCRAIAENDFSTQIKKSSKNKSLHSSWQALKHAVRRHTDVSVIYTSSQNNEHMMAAHYATQEGALKPLKNPKKMCDT